MTVTKNAEKLNRKANRCKVLVYNPNGVYRILSPSGSTYTVDLMRGGICSCEWGERGNAGCAHEMAARKDWEARHNGRRASFQPGDAAAVARQQHKATKPVASQGSDAVTLVLRDRVDEVARLDAEIDALGQEWQALNRAICPADANRGQWWADRRAELERLRGLLMERQRERARAANERMREGRAA